MASDYLKGPTMTEETAPQYNDIHPITDDSAGLQRLRWAFRQTLHRSEYHVQEYGTTLNNATVQAAIDAANTNGGGKVIFHKGTYTLTGASGITLYSNIELEFHPEAVIDATGMNNSTDLFTANGTETGSEALTANAAKGDTTLTVADESAFSAGDWVKIGSEDLWTPNSTPISGVDARIGEINMVLSTASGQITLRWPIQDSYAIVDNAFVAKMNMLENIHFKGPGEIIGKGSGTVSGIVINRAVNCSVNGLRFQDFNESAIEYIGCVDCNVHNIHVTSPNVSSGNHYGVLFRIGSQDCRLTNSYFRDVRHAITTGGSTTTSGIVRRIKVAHCHAVDTTAAAFDTHAACNDVDFVDCEAFNCSSGFQIRNPRAGINGCRVIGSTNWGVRLKNQSDRPTAWTVDGNQFIECGSEGIQVADPTDADLAGTAAGQTVDFIDITNNGVHAPGSSAIEVISLESWAMEGANVSGNTISSVTSARSIHLNNCQYCSVTVNNIRGNSSSTAGIELDGSDHNNIEDNFVESATGPGGAHRGVNLDNSDFNLIANNKVLRHTTGVDLDASSDNNRIIGGDYRTCTTQVSIAGSGNTYLGEEQFQLKALSGQTIHIQEWLDSSANVLMSVSENGYLKIKKTSAPADAELDNNELVMWWDESTPQVAWKAKDNGGTVRTGTLALS